MMLTHWCIKQAGFDKDCVQVYCAAMQSKARLVCSHQMREKTAAAAAAAEYYCTYNIQASLHSLLVTLLVGITLVCTFV